MAITVPQGFISQFQFQRANSALRKTPPLSVKNEKKGGHHKNMKSQRHILMLVKEKMVGWNPSNLHSHFHWQRVGKGFLEKKTPSSHTHAVDEKHPCILRAQKIVKHPAKLWLLGTGHEDQEPQLAEHVQVSSADSRLLCLCREKSMRMFPLLQNFLMRTSQLSSSLHQAPPSAFALPSVLRAVRDSQL